MQDDDTVDPLAPLATLDEVKDRVDRLLRGEDITKPQTVPVIAGDVPRYYGENATSSEVYAIWIKMLRQNTDPMAEAFYQAGAIGWASR